MESCCDLSAHVGHGAAPGELGPATEVAAWICQAVRARVVLADHAAVAWHAWNRVLEYGTGFVADGPAQPRTFVQRLALHEIHDYRARRGYWKERRAAGEAPLPRDPEDRKRAQDLAQRASTTPESPDEAPARPADQPDRRAQDRELGSAIDDCVRTNVPPTRVDEFHEWVMQRHERGHLTQMAKVRGVRPDTLGDRMAKFLLRVQECLSRKKWGPPGSAPSA